MRYMTTQWTSRLAALGLVCGLTAGLAAAGAAQSVSGQAYGAYVNTALASQPQSVVAVLPAIAATDGDMAAADADALNVRSEERRVGKECRCGWAPDDEKE